MSIIFSLVGGVIPILFVSNKITAHSSFPVVTILLLAPFAVIFFTTDKIRARIDADKKARQHLELCDSRPHDTGRGQNGNG